jgi:hypothetical protein
VLDPSPSLGLVSVTSSSHGSEANWSITNKAVSYNT